MLLTCAPISELPSNISTKLLHFQLLCIITPVSLVAGEKRTKSRWSRKKFSCKNRSFVFLSFFSWYFSIFGPNENLFTQLFLFMYEYIHQGCRSGWVLSGSDLWEQTRIRNLIPIFYLMIIAYYFFYIHIKVNIIYILIPYYH